MVASSRPRDARGERGTATSHGKHNTKRWRKRGGHQGDRLREAAPRTTAARHTPHRHAPTRRQTPHRHHTHHTHTRPAARATDGGTPTATQPRQRQVSDRPYLPAPRTGGQRRANVSPPHPQPTTPTARATKRAATGAGQPQEVRTPFPALRHRNTAMGEPTAPRKTRPRSPTLEATHKVIRALGALGSDEHPPPPGRRGHALRPGDDSRGLRRQRVRGARAACGQRARPPPRLEAEPLHRGRLVLQATPAARRRKQGTTRGGARGRTRRPALRWRAGLDPG